MFRKWRRNFRNFGRPVANDTHLMGFLFFLIRHSSAEQINPLGPPLLVGIIALWQTLLKVDGPQQPQQLAVGAAVIVEAAILPTLMQMDDKVQQHNQELRKRAHGLKELYVELHQPLRYLVLS